MNKKTKWLNVGPPIGVGILNDGLETIEKYSNGDDDYDIDGLGEHIHRFGPLEWILPGASRFGKFDDESYCERTRIRGNLADCCVIYNQLKHSIDNRPPIKKYAEFINQLLARYDKKFQQLEEIRRSSFDEDIYEMVSRNPHLRSQSNGAVNARLREIHQKLEAAEALINKSRNMINEIKYEIKPGPNTRYSLRIALYILAAIYSDYAEGDSLAYVANKYNFDKGPEKWIYKSPFFKFVVHFLKIADPVLLKKTSNNALGQQAQEMAQLYRSRPGLSFDWENLDSHEILVEFVELVSSGFKTTCP